MMLWKKSVRENKVDSCVQTILWLQVILIFNVHTDVNACDFTWGGWGGGML